MQCKCQSTIDMIKLSARDGIVQELNHQLSEKEKLINRLQNEIELLKRSLIQMQNASTLLPKPGK
jgi:uncharacterized coiled-coil protein SlyX